MATTEARPAGAAMTLREHLVEARRRIIWSMWTTVVVAVVAYFFYPPLLKFLQHPYCAVTPHHCTFLVTNPLDGLTLRIKISLAGGLLGSSPVWLWHLWRFITPGLKARERRYAIPFVGATMLFFLGGVTLAYLVFARALAFLQSVGGNSLTTYYSPNEYLTLLLLMMVIFGLTFEFPVILVALELAGLVTPAALLRRWRYAVIGIVVVSGVITPSSDPFSMFAMMLPLIVFYFAAIGLGKLMGK